MRTTLPWCLAVVIGAVACKEAAAAPVTVLNPSFELPVFADSGHNYASPVNFWTKSAGNITSWNPPATAFSLEPTAADDGLQVVALDSAGSNIRQTLTDVLQPYTQYTLSVAVGRRNPPNQVYDGYRIELRAGGTTLVSEQNVVSPPIGGFVDAVLSFSTADAHPQLGQPLEIFLSRPTIGLGGTTVDFDNVRLDALALAVPLTPEPGSLLLFGLAAGEIGFLYWRRRRRAALQPH